MVIDAPLSEFEYRVPDGGPEMQLIKEAAGQEHYRYTSIWDIPSAYVRHHEAFDAIVADFADKNDGEVEEFKHMLTFAEPAANEHIVEASSHHAMLALLGYAGELSQSSIHPIVKCKAVGLPTRQLNC